MDKIISARIDERMARRLDMLARELGLSKKKILEDAIMGYSAKQKKGSIDILEKTSGCWKRKESTEEIIKRAKGSFKDSMLRHKE